MRAAMSAMRARETLVKPGLHGLRGLAARRGLGTSGCTEKKGILREAAIAPTATRRIRSIRLENGIRSEEVRRNMGADADQCRDVQQIQDPNC